jgi:hypothetical protein
MALAPQEDKPPARGGGVRDSLLEREFGLPAPPSP